MTDIERACEHRCAMHPCTHICEYAALYVAGMNAGRKEREDEIKQVEQVNENLGAFIDWCAANHEEIVKEYTGFLEVGK